MLVNNYPYTNNINFNAKIRLKDANKFIGTSSFEKSPVDAVFKENSLVKMLNKLSVIIKNNILCKHLDHTTSDIGEKLKKICQKSIFLSRVLADRIFLMSNYKSIKEMHKDFINMDFNSKEYIEELSKLGNSIGSKYIIANTEDKTLNYLAKTDTSTIFVMNHPNYHKDKLVYLYLNSLLNKLYVKEGKQENCPRPKVLVSRMMFKIVHKKIAQLYQKFGMVPVDASLSHRDNQYNAHSIKHLFIDFIRNKSNIFIFPEGNNSSYTKKSLEDKMQIGIAEFIQKALSLKESVRVVSIGIDYPKKSNSLGKIHISKPLYFRKDGDDIVYKHYSREQPFEITKGNIPQKILRVLTRDLSNSVSLAKNSKE